MARPKNDGKGRLGGRAKGTPNKVKSTTRQVLTEIFNNELEHLPELLEQMEARDRVHAMSAMAKFVIPSLTSIEMNDKTQSHTKLADALEELVRSKKK